MLLQRDHLISQLAGLLGPLTQFKLCLLQTLGLRAANLLQTAMALLQIL